MKKYIILTKARNRNGVFMLNKLIYDFFFINLKDYPNIGIDFEINVFLLVLTVALSVCFFVANHHRSMMQTVLKQLTRHGAKDEGSAKTLRELGLDRSFSLKWALSHTGQLTRIVGRVGEKVYTYEEYVALSKQKGGIKDEKIDFAEAKFYIRESAGERAKHIVENYGTSTGRAVLYCVLFLALYVCIALSMPEILSIIDGWLGGA